MPNQSPLRSEQTPEVLEKSLNSNYVAQQSTTCSSKSKHNAALLLLAEVVTWKLELLASRFIVILFT
jgi:hypothetical protein